MKQQLLQVICILITLLPAGNFAAPMDQWFERANTFYEKQMYDSALSYYNKIVESGINNCNVYYNIGNVYFRQNKLGLAILNFEKAYKQNPKDADISANLRFAQLNIVDRIPMPARSFFNHLSWRLHTLFSLNSQLWILFFCLLFLSLSFAFGLFVSHNVRLWLIYIASLCILIGGLLSISVSIKIYDAEKKQFAIVLEKTVDAKNQPDGNKVLFTVHEGTKFQIKKSFDNWCFVSLPNGVSGWVENDTLGKI